MAQRLAENRVRKPLKTTTQNYKVVEIWKTIDKSSFLKEKNEDLKVQKKGDLYALVCQKYEEKQGETINRSTVRRCVNTYINQNSQG